MKAHNNTSAIGIFDSGVGGLSVLRALHQSLPNEDYIYIADQAHIPYGPRSRQELLAFSKAISHYLLHNEAKLVVVACNTASAAALKTLRADYPDTNFVGMEPAVKPAVEQSESGVVGVLATPSTFEGDLYASVVGRFAQGATLLSDTCSGLVEEIEAGRANGTEAKRILASALEPMLAQGLDTVVLGCTHYPFALDSIREITGPDVRLIDPSPAIANRVESLLIERDALNPSNLSGSTKYLTTGESSRMRTRIQELLNNDVAVERLNWDQGKIISLD